ncbi:MAG: hypothetical protein QTN59_13900 [Candidatus Electrothrix communis]|nr:MAG: hypothetical protein QTN59_13900 [Candidatus Electrothrix communis]
MYEQVEKPKENKSKAVANSVVQKKSGVKQGFGFVDNRPGNIMQRRFQKEVDQSQLSQPIQQKIDLFKLQKEQQDWKKTGPNYNYMKTVDNDTRGDSANIVGMYWVKDGGGGFKKEKYGASSFDYQLVGRDGKRKYRPPMMKKSGQSIGEVQANYEERD